MVLLATAGGALATDHGRGNGGSSAGAGAGRGDGGWSAGAGAGRGDGGWSAGTTAGARRGAGFGIGAGSAPSDSARVGGNYGSTGTGTGARGAPWGPPPAPAPGDRRGANGPAGVGGPESGTGARGGGSGRDRGRHPAAWAITPIGGDSAHRTSSATRATTRAARGRCATGGCTTGSAPSGAPPVKGMLVGLGSMGATPAGGTPTAPSTPTPTLTPPVTPPAPTGTPGTVTGAQPVPGTSLVAINTPLAALPAAVLGIGVPASPGSPTHGVLSALSSPATIGSLAGGSTEPTTAVALTAGHTPRPAGDSRASRQADGGPSVIPRFVERFVQVIPLPIWIALAASFGLAMVGGVAALRSGRRARRQAEQIATVSVAALTDPLTGVFNRRGFTEASERELARARRYGRPLVLAYVDVRGLKAVNDTHGHLAGDTLIREAAQLLRSSARADDVVGRIGGDELALLLAEQTADGGAVVAARVSAAIAARRPAVGLGTDWDLTIGLATFPEDGQTFEELLSTADRRLYEQRGIALH